MYTVLRITPAGTSDQPLLDAITALNLLAPASLIEPRRRGDGFARSVSQSPEWESHAREVEEYLRIVGDELRKLTAVGVAVTFDVAVDPDDLRPLVTTFRFPPRLIELLEQSGAALEVSFYEGE